MRTAKIFVTVAVLVFISTATWAGPDDPVYFADPNLKSVVEAELGITDPNTTDMLGLIELRKSRGGITDLTGLEYATNLTKLQLYNNQISDLSPLAGLTNLERLYLYNNQISDLSPLNGLTNLERLDLDRNQISDLFPLAGLTNMEYLDLFRNQISDISALSGLTNLADLSLNNNQISDISPLSNLTNLWRLNLPDNQISDISALSGLTNLADLSLDNNQIIDISPLSNLTNLQMLILGANQISDISALSNLTKLWELYLYYNQISDISPLSNLKSLSGLGLGWNQISDISPLSNLKRLMHLVLENNQISDISPLSNLTRLRELILRDNQISDVSALSNLTNLQLLILETNQISDISPLSNLTNLDALLLCMNPLNQQAYNIYIPMIEDYGTFVDYEPLEWRTLTTSSTTGGSVIEPGEGEFDYTNLTTVDIKAASYDGYYFTGWSGTVGRGCTVEDITSPSTTVTMNQDYTLLANFAEVSIVYVDSNAAGSNDGSSWENAYFCLQDALEAAQTGDEIRVAKGVYVPDQRYVYGQLPQVISSGIRSETFQLINRVSLKGGYAGNGEPDPNARDIELYETILSGDLNGDDAEVTNLSDLINERTRAENSFHVITCIGTNETAILDGFIIAGGNAAWSWEDMYSMGGGMYNENSRPTLANCTFSGNSATDYGGAMINLSNSNPTVTNCVFSGNWATDYGGAMENINSSPILTNCTFSGNSANWEAGGIDNFNNSNPTVTNCVFSGNWAADSGGAMKNINSSPTLTYCTFNNNSTKVGGGMYNYDSNPTLTNCTFIGNSSEEFGGGMYNGDGSYPILTYCTFSENTAVYDGGGMYNDEGSSPTLSNCTFSVNSSKQDGGGMWNILSNPILTNCTFELNEAFGSAGAMENINSSPTLINCTFIGNSALEQCGGMRNSDDSNPTLINCTFSGNTGVDEGGGMLNRGFSDPTLINCIFSGNSAGYGGGIINEVDAYPTLINCTIYGNSAQHYGGGISNNADSHSTVINCIIWGNTASEGAQIYNGSESSITVSYSDVHFNGRGAWPGEGNIKIDPLFADPDNDDYHLKSEAGRWDPNSKMWVADNVTSPCIDISDPNFGWAAEIWPHGERMNIGAYGGTAEASMSLSDAGILGDLNNDDLITWDDVLILAEKWDSNDVPLKEDLDLGGVVDVNDLTFYEGNWSEDFNNTAPVIDSIEFAFLGSELSFAVSAIDDDGDDLTYLALGLPDGATFEEQVFSWTPEHAGIYLITFVVSDYKSLDYFTVQITVEDQ